MAKQYFKYNDQGQKARPINKLDNHITRSEQKYPRSKKKVIRRDTKEVGIRLANIRTDGTTKT